MADENNLPKTVRAANSGNLLEDLKGNLSDNELAKLFIHHYGDDLKFVPEWNRWAIWTGEIWEIEKIPKQAIKAKAVLMRFIEKLYIDGMTYAATLKTIREENEIIKFVRSIQNARRPNSILDFAKSLPGVSVSATDFDANPLLIQCQNAVISFENKHCPAFKVPSLDWRDPNVPEYTFKRSHMITKRADVNYFGHSLECQSWLDHLDLIFNGDQDLIDYMQKLCGYFLVGTTELCIMPFAFGDGANGKSVFWNTINGIMGEYSGTASSELLMPSKEANLRLQAELHGKRAVFVGEPKSGRKIDDGKVKELTGDDTIVCARLYENPWEFTPTHTFFCSTNHKPIVNTTDKGIWRRIKLIPFTVDVEEALKEKGGADPKFLDKLKGEWPGIFKWMIEGFKKYRNHGLKDCQAIIDATAEYRAEEDTFQAFVDECLCYPVEKAEISITAAWNLYRDQGNRITRSAFKAKMLKLKGVEFDRCTEGNNKGKMVFRGIGEPREEFL